MTLQWKSPPAVRRAGRGSAARLDTITAALKARPGEWALLGHSTYTTGCGTASLRKRGCETTVRRRPDRAFDIYARWPVAP